MEIESDGNCMGHRMYSDVCEKPDLTVDRINYISMCKEL